jgi:hypothetical protein
VQGGVLTFVTMTVHQVMRLAVKAFDFFVCGVLVRHRASTTDTEEAVNHGVHSESFLCFHQAANGLSIHYP